MQTLEIEAGVVDGQCAFDFYFSPLITLLES